MENCVIYARFSSHGQNEQSIEAQVRICKEYAESKGLDVVNLYTDKARTGTNDARPAFQKMIADAKTGTFQYIIVYMFDRFARNRRDSIIYKEMLKEKYGIKVISALESRSYRHWNRLPKTKVASFMRCSLNGMPRNTVKGFPKESATDLTPA